MDRKRPFAIAREVLRRPVKSAQYVSIKYTERLAEAGIEPVMKCLLLATALALLSPAPIALADCESDTADILKATAATAPIRRFSNYLDKGAPDHTVTRDFSPPDQIKEVSVSRGGNFVSTVLVSGKTAWSSVKSPVRADRPPSEFDGSLFLPDTLQFRLPPTPATECSNDGAEIKLVWKSTDGKNHQQYTARADAKTNVLIAVDGFLKDEKGNIESEEHTTFSSIPAFTNAPPAGAVKLDSGPKYAKVGDVDPEIPMPADAAKIGYSKGISLRFETPQRLSTLVDFYSEKYKSMGWKEEDARSKENYFEAKFRDAQVGWVMFEAQERDGATQVFVGGPYPKN